MTEAAEQVPYYMHATKETISSLCDAIYNDLVETYGAIAIKERFRQLDLAYPNRSSFLAKLKLRCVDKFKTDIEEIVEDVEQLLEEKFSMDGYIFKHHQIETQIETTDEAVLDEEIAKLHAQLAEQK